MKRAGMKTIIYLRKVYNETSFDGNFKTCSFTIDDRSGSFILHSIFIYSSNLSAVHSCCEVQIVQIVHAT